MLGPRRAQRALGPEAITSPPRCSTTTARPTPSAVRAAQFWMPWPLQGFLSAPAQAKDSFLLRPASTLRPFARPRLGLLHAAGLLHRPGTRPRRRLVGPLLHRQRKNSNDFLFCLRSWPEEGLLSCNPRCYETDPHRPTPAKGPRGALRTIRCAMS